MAATTEFFVQYRRHRPLSNTAPNLTPSNGGAYKRNDQGSQDHMSLWENNWQATFDGSNNKKSESFYGNNAREAAEQSWQQLTQPNNVAMEMSKLTVSSSASHSMSRSTSQTASISSYSGDGDDATSLTSSEEGEEVNLLGLPSMSTSHKPSSLSRRNTRSSTVSSVSSSSVSSFNGGGTADEVDDYIVHTVVPTDTIQGLCLRYKINSTKLRQANGSVSCSPQDLLAQSKLYIPVDAKRRAALGDIPPHVLLSNAGAGGEGKGGQQGRGGSTAGSDFPSSCVDLLSFSSPTTAEAQKEEDLLIDLSTESSNNNNNASGVLVMSHKNLPGMSMTEAANRWSCVAQDGRTMSAVHGRSTAAGSSSSSRSAPSSMAESFLTNLSSTSTAGKLLNAVGGGGGSGTLKRRAKAGAGAFHRRNSPDEYEMIDFTDSAATTTTTTTTTQGSSYRQYFVGSTTMAGKKQG